MDNRKDEVLMMEYRDTRDPEAMVSLFKRYRRPLFQYLVRRTGSPSRAEDLTQEVFASLMKGADRYQPSGSFKSYIYRMASNISAKEWRTYRKRVQLQGELVDHGTEAGKKVDSIAQAAKVRNALLNLDDAQRDAIVLREYQGLTYEEISQVMGVAVGTIKSRIARGKLALREMLLGTTSPEAGQIGVRS